jgi:hypothetical protein
LVDNTAHLLFLPDRAAPRMFLWGPQASAATLGMQGRAERVRCFTPRQSFETVIGQSTALIDALPRLAALTARDMERLPASISAWSLAAKFALDLVARGRIVPRIEAQHDGTEATCGISLAMSDDADRFAKLAGALPLAAHALPVVDPQKKAGPQKSPAPSKRGRPSVRDTEPHQVWAPDALLERFLNAAADTIVRHAMQRPPRQRPLRQAFTGWERRLLNALGERDADFSAQGFGERSLIDDLRKWIKPVGGAQRGEARICLRLELPQDNAQGTPAQFRVRFLLQAASDPSVLVQAAEVYGGKRSTLRHVARDVRSAQESLLTGLATAGRLFPPIQASLRNARPEEVLLGSATAFEFLDAAAPRLIEAGIGVILPAELTRSGQRRLRMRMRVGGNTARTAKGTDGASGFSLDSVLEFRWQAELAGETLTEKELRELAQLKSPLIQHRGQWVAVESAEVAEALRLLGQRDGALATHEALAAALGVANRGETTLPVDVVVEGSFATLVARLGSAANRDDISPPSTLNATLRPYQLRGLNWLASMADLGLGACLADDMGLGKTVQLIALLLHRRHLGQSTRPILLVCPTSVVGNWERELERFAPSLPFVRHYGAMRARTDDAFENIPDGAIVLTTYGLLRRDAQALAGVQWSVAALDEAQNIKNASSRTAQAARALQAEFRVALTGTPVENRLAELWSIFEFLNPRLLGPMAAFRRDYAIPIERYGQADVADRLRRIVQPFVLRRLKSDRNVIHDLPDKQEMKVICSLTREQASLYQAELDEAMRKIEDAEGIERRGLVLALITALKQICNHPAQYLGEAGPLQGRSGKLQRSIEMLEEVVAVGDRALVFTQYREMGDRLVAEVARVLGIDAPFLHGGVARGARDEMVRRFQEDLQSAPIFVLSVKAGGTGLNLTAANHVFHFDRWWNPAVEDQATDRAYRIGQSRSVQVHKLLCAGTVEEKIDLLLEQKRDLASRIVGAGEQWITELDNKALRDLFSLAPDAVVTDNAADADDRDEQDIGKARKIKRAAVRT